MSDVKVSVGIGDAIFNLISQLFTGSPLDAVIAILLICVGGLIFVVWRLSKKIKNDEKRLDEYIAKSNEQLKELTERYVNSIHGIQEKNERELRLMNSSMDSTRVLLSEIKVLLSVVVNQPTS